MAIKGGTNVPVKIKIPVSLQDEIRRLQALGRYKDHFENEFVCYLIELGLMRYEKVVLPIERGEDIDATRATALHDPKVRKTANGG
jgi:hypothetical protein